MCILGTSAEAALPPRAVRLLLFVQASFVNIPLQDDQKGGHFVVFEVQLLPTANNRGCKSFLGTVMTRINYQLYRI